MAGLMDAQAQAQKYARMQLGDGSAVAPAMSAVPLDPRGLVPVQRAQPQQGDGGEAQRLLERRMATMPPSAFSGAGMRSPIAPASPVSVGRALPFNHSAPGQVRIQQFGRPEPVRPVTTNPLHAPLEAKKRDRMEFLRQQLALGNTRNGLMAQGRR